MSIFGPIGAALTVAARTYDAVVGVGPIFKAADAHWERACRARRADAERDADRLADAEAEEEVAEPQEDCGLGTERREALGEYTTPEWFGDWPDATDSDRLDLIAELLLDIRNTLTAITSVAPGTSPPDAAAEGPATATPHPTGDGGAGHLHPDQRRVTASTAWIDLRRAILKDRDPSK